MEGVKDLWVGCFNYYREIHIEYTYAYTERQAWLLMCKRLSHKVGVHPSVIMRYFDGESNNFSIRKEIEYEVDDEDKPHVDV